MKLDYRTSLGLSQEMALEFLSLRPRLALWKRLIGPLVLGFIFARIFGPLSYSHMVVLGSESVMGEKIQAIFATGAFGFGIAILWLVFSNHRVKHMYMEQIRNSASAQYPERTFSWDDTGIGFSSPVAAHRWKWAAVDDIWNGKVAIHFISRGHLLFCVPKEILPPEAQADQLKELMRRDSPPPLPAKSLL